MFSTEKVISEFKVRKIKGISKSHSCLEMPGGLSGYRETQHDHQNDHEHHEPESLYKIYRCFHVDIAFIDN